MSHQYQAENDEDELNSSFTSSLSSYDAGLTKKLWSDFCQSSSSGSYSYAPSHISAPSNALLTGSSTQSSFEKCPDSTKHKSPSVISLFSYKPGDSDSEHPSIAELNDFLVPKATLEYCKKPAFIGRVGGNSGESCNFSCNSSYHSSKEQPQNSSSRFQLPDIEGSALEAALHKLDGLKKKMSVLVEKKADSENRSTYFSDYSDPAFPYVSPYSSNATTKSKSYEQADQQQQHEDQLFEDDEYTMSNYDSSDSSSSRFFDDNLPDSHSQEGEKKNYRDLQGVGNEGWKSPGKYWKPPVSDEDEGEKKEAGDRKSANKRVVDTLLLEQWLNDHLDNPYPNRAEKTILAIVSHCTMSQVSVFFADARFRLKMENKLSWSSWGPQFDDEDEEFDEHDNDDLWTSGVLPKKEPVPSRNLPNHKPAEADEFKRPAFDRTLNPARVSKEITQKDRSIISGPASTSVLERWVRHQKLQEWKEEEELSADEKDIVLGKTSVAQQEVATAEEKKPGPDWMQDVVREQASKIFATQLAAQKAEKEKENSAAGSMQNGEGQVEKVKKEQNIVASKELTHEKPNNFAVEAVCKTVSSSIPSAPEIENPQARDNFLNDWGRRDKQLHGAVSEINPLQFITPKQYLNSSSTYSNRTLMQKNHNYFSAQPPPIQCYGNSVAPQQQNLSTQSQGERWISELIELEAVKFQKSVELAKDQFTINVHKLMGNDKLKMADMVKQLEKRDKALAAEKEKVAVLNAKCSRQRDALRTISGLVVTPAHFVGHQLGQVIKKELLEEPLADLNKIVDLAFEGGDWGNEE